MARVRVRDGEQLPVALPESVGVYVTEAVREGLRLPEAVGVALLLPLRVMVVSEGVAVGLNDAVGDGCRETLAVCVAEVEAVPETKAEGVAVRLTDGDAGDSVEELLRVRLRV